MMTDAPEKQMTRPVTSTRVATNGADALAGSNPCRRMTSGSIEAARVPQRTTPTRLTPTDVATSPDH